MIKTDKKEGPFYVIHTYQGLGDEVIHEGLYCLQLCGGDCSVVAEVKSGGVVRMCMYVFIEREINICMCMYVYRERD